MAVLGKAEHTVNNRTRWIIDYSDWLDRGQHIVTAPVTSSSTTATVDGVALLDDKRHVVFFTNGGVLNETFTVTVVMTDTLTQIKKDTIDFVVVAP